MGILQSRVIVAVKAGQWDAARAIGKLQVADANARPGTLAYEIYEDAAAGHLINIAAYRDADAWAAHIAANPHAQSYMRLCDVVSIEIHGDPPPALRAKIESFGSARIYPTIV